MEFEGCAWIYYWTHTRGIRAQFYKDPREMQNAEVEVMISSANEFIYSRVIPGRKQYYYILGQMIEMKIQR